MIRALTLMKMVVSGTLNRLRFDLARELVVLISGGVVIATFAYIINDFLNVQISGLSQVMRDRFAEPVAIALLLICAFKAGALIRREWSGIDSTTGMAAFLGEIPGVIRAYKMLFGFSSLVLLHGAAWWVVSRYLVQPSVLQVAGGGILMMFTTILSGYWYREKNKATEHDAGNWLQTDPENTSGKLRSFVRWRLAQLLLRNRTARVCFLVSGSMYLLLIPLQAAGIPFFASVACTILASIIAGAALFFQLAEDLNYAWAERTMGISHQDFCRGYQSISLFLALPMIIFAVGCYSLGSMLPGGGFALTEAGTLALISLTTPVIAPMLMFQIDGRRPVINLILLTIAAMFIDTAIFANWLSVILIPVLQYYASGSQNGRFYRA